MMNSQDSTDVNIKRNWPWSTIKKSVAIAISVLTVITALLGLYQWYDYINSKPELTFNVVDNQCLTRPSKEALLDCSFKFKGKEVHNFWISKVQIENTCRRNIIGVDGHDLISSNISFSVSSPFKIVYAEVDSSDVDLKISYLDSSFSLSFRKWRPHSGCIIRVYCEADTSTCAGPSFRDEPDPLAQGQIVISDFKEIRHPRCLLMRWPFWLSFVIRWIGVLLYGGIIIVSVFMFTFKMGWIKFLKSLFWNRKYLLRVNELVKMSESENSKSLYSMPETFWKKNKIPPPPPRSDLVNGTTIKWGDIYPPFIIVVILSLVSLVALSALIEF